MSVGIWFLAISSFTRSRHLSFGLPRFCFPSLSSAISFSWRHLYLAFAHVQTIGYIIWVPFSRYLHFSQDLVSSFLFPTAACTFWLHAIMAIILQILQKVCRNIYTIILYKSVCLRSQTAGRNSCSIVSGDVSNWSYRLTVHPVTSSRGNRVASACCLFQWPCHSACQGHWNKQHALATRWLLGLWMPAEQAVTGGRLWIALTCTSVAMAVCVCARACVCAHTLACVRAWCVCNIR